LGSCLRTPQGEPKCERCDQRENPNGFHRLKVPPAFWHPSFDALASRGNAVLPRENNYFRYKSLFVFVVLLAFARIHKQF
jgi:hypothetical protein